MKAVLDSGQVIDLGATKATPTIGITDYSRRVTDDFGVTTVVERGFSRTMSVQVAVPFDRVDELQRTLAGLRATPAQWVADDRFASLSIRGFYKEFSIDVATSSLSFCTLSVEGLAGTDVVADAGGDPAPEALRSTLQLLRPIAVTGAQLVASNVAEADAPEWAANKAYPSGVRVIKAATHRIYESLAAVPAGDDPAAASGKWLDVGPTNRWAMFDQALGSVTTANGSIAVAVDVGAIDAVAVLDVVGATVRVQATDYDRTVPIAGGSISLLDLPNKAGRVTVTIAGNGTVSAGTLLVGHRVALGLTEAAPTAGITDFSRKVVDDFGEVTVVERAWAKRMTANSLIRTDAVDAVASRIAAVRAQPVLWIGRVGTDSLTIYGFFKDFSIEIGKAVSKLSLSIEGLSTAGKIEPLGTLVEWPDIADPTGTKPANNADKTSENTSKDTAAVGGRPSGTVIETIDKARTDIDGLIEAVSEGQTDLSEQVNAANAARDASQTARDQSQAARDAASAASTLSGAARDAAKTAQTNAEAAASTAAQRATDASGYAQTATGQATIATQQADAAGQSASSASASATTASTKAGEASTSAQSAVTAKNDAAGSATSAGTSAGVATQAKTDAQAAATAASTSASTASSKADAAGQSATSAAGSATTAATRAGEASTSAGQASTSASTAAGSATSAATNQALTATARDAAQAAAQKTFPSTFEDDKLYWDHQLTRTYSAEAGAYVISNTAGSYGGLQRRGTIPNVAGKKWRLRVRAKADRASYSMLVRVLGFPNQDQSGAQAGNYYSDATITLTTAYAWYEVIIDAPADGTARWIAPVCYPGYPANTGVVSVAAFEMTDATSDQAAAASANASNTSASSAAASKTGADTAASAANQSKLDAQTALGGANAARDTAVTSASNAKGSENAAASSATLSAQTATQAGVLASGNLVRKPSFEDGRKDGWEYWGDGNATYGKDGSLYFARTYGLDTCVYYPSSGNGIKKQWGGRTVRIRALISTAETDGSFGAGLFIEADTGNRGYPIQYLGARKSWTWIDYNYTIPDGIIAINPWFQLTTPGNGSAGLISYFEVTDITESSKAAGSASAAVTSASAAKTSQDGAGASAVAANQSRIDAQAANGAAQGSASAAASSAASATASASSAQTSATLASSFGASSLNRNPFFADPAWTRTDGDNNVPSGNYAPWASDGAGYIGPFGGTGRFPAANPYTGKRQLQIDRQGTNAGVRYPLGAMPKGNYIIEVDVSGEDGIWDTSGVHINFNNGYAYNFHFASIADTAGATGGGANNRRQWSFLVWNGADTNDTQMYAMAGWSGFTGQAYPGFLRTIWAKWSIRPATSTEVNLPTTAARIESINQTLSNQYGALAQRISNTEATAGNLSARTGVTESAVADLRTKSAAARLEFSATSPGGRAAVTIRSDSNNGAGIDLVGDVAFTGNQGGAVTVVNGLGVKTYDANGNLVFQCGIY
ncbi:hypothetical protein [Sphingomonas sp. RIT328]|uniref:hypothetical protein n=1 Tax=Sphingomonas sp. RIT328 TaxID=1470591 RepID=UPI00044C7EC5|nr:hypothetical protein [Sphingomonas sp. RIT328]EZP57263.1 hypothetical protein BW41_00106 [Sphingomonas sp. RIT328]